MAMTADVNVVFEKELPIPQQRSFRCCPLGMQFFSPRQHADGTFLQIAFDPQNAGPEKTTLCCEGMVVCSEPEEDSDLYRHWVFFLDLPDALRQQLQCLTDTMETRCPWCENF